MTGNQVPYYPLGKAFSLTQMTPCLSIFDYEVLGLGKSIAEGWLVCHPERQKMQYIVQYISIH